MRPERRPYAEIVAWSSTHGLAMLIIDGPLGAVPEDAVAVAIGATIDAIVAGLCA